MNNYNLTLKDLKLIEQLEVDSRQSLSQIAKKIGVSKEVANYRLNRLLNDEFVTGFRAVINYYALGYKHYRFLINLMSYEPKLREEIIYFFHKIPLCHCNGMIQTEYDLEILIWAKDEADLKKVYDSFLEAYAEKIRESLFFIVLKEHVLRHSYLYGKQRIISFGNESAISKVDEDDKKIIDLLNYNPKISSLDISKKTGVPQSSLVYKLRLLEQKGILKTVTPILNSALLGFTKYQIYLYIKSPKKKNQLISYLSEKKNVVKIFELIGSMDLSIEAYFQSSKQADDFIIRLRTDMPEIFDSKVMIKI